MHKLGLVTLLVREYDEAITFFTGALPFVLVEDTELSAGKRWVVIAPAGASEAGILLARATTPEQLTRMGDQMGGRVSWFLHTDDFIRDYESMRAHGVKFLEDPRREAYGTVAVFADLYGNRWDLLEPVVIGA